VAFRASLDPGSFEIGIWVRSGGILNFVTRTGIDAPGTIGRTFDFFNPPVLNAVGEVAFDAVLDFVVEEPPGPFAITTEPSDPATSQGIWAGSPDHLGLVIRAGDVLEVRPGDFRKVLRPILGLFASGNDDSRGSTFNNAGQVVFAAVLEDGSEGIFVASRLVAKNDLVSLPKGKTITIDVLANDMDPFGDGLSVVATGLPSNGAVTLNPDDTVTYSRNGSFKNGCDEFTYAVLDSRGRTHEGLVQVAVGSGTCGPGPTGTLKGTVKKDGKRISGASVRLDPGTASERQVTTNKAGKYGFDSVPAGIHTFTATDGVCGVEPFSILVTAGQTFTYDAKLVCP